MPGEVSARKFRAWRETKGALHVDFVSSVTSQQLCVHDDGFLDLASTLPASGGKCYIGHLPILGMVGLVIYIFFFFGGGGS